MLEVITYLNLDLLAKLAWVSTLASKSIQGGGRGKASLGTDPGAN